MKAYVSATSSIYIVNNIFEPAAIDWNVDQAIVDKLLKLSKASMTMIMTASSKNQRANLIEKIITSSEHRHVRIKTTIECNTVEPLYKGHIGTR